MLQGFVFFSFVHMVVDRTGKSSQSCYYKGLGIFSFFVLPAKFAFPYLALFVGEKKKKKETALLHLVWTLRKWGWLTICCWEAITKKYNR